jgi:ADP-ribose pyrophosphatase YjhB (NUDIX family)
MNSPKNNCINCGKYGHHSKTCNEAILSYGIIVFNIDKQLDMYKYINTYLHEKILDINDYNCSNLDNIKLIPEFYNKIKLLMIRRKHSLNYVDFIRGKYELDKLVNNNIFKLMSVDEIKKIKSESFNTLWNDLWLDTANNKIYQREYNISKNKFNTLVQANFYNLLDSMSSFTYMDPEWEFPKGRKNINESNIECAMREFSEETNIDLSFLNILKEIKCLEEEYYGTNSKKYNHKYYLANIAESITLSKDINMTNEVSDIRWVTISEALEKVRPYHNAKIKIIHQIYFFIINLIVNISKNKELIEV